MSGFYPLLILSVDSWMDFIYHPFYDDVCPLFNPKVKLNVNCLMQKIPNQTFLCGTCKFELRAVTCDWVDDIWALLSFLLQSLWEDTYSQMIYFNLLESVGRIQIDSPHHSSFPIFVSDNAIFLNYLSQCEASKISSKDLCKLDSDGSELTSMQFSLLQRRKLVYFCCIHRNNVSLICLG